jgi:AhpD family alkylhydroperoxidase
LTIIPIGKIMSHAERFPSLSIETAPAAARPILRASARQFGFVPGPLARGASSPGLLEQVLAGLRAFEHTSLSELEREVVALSVAYERGCAYCMALHSALLSRSPEHTGLLQALRSGATLADARLEALRVFSRELLVPGRIEPASWRRFEQAGFTPVQALEVALGVGAYVLSTLLNIMVEAPVDAAFAAFTWSARGAEQ